MQTERRHEEASREEDGRYNRPEGGGDGCWERTAPGELAVLLCKKVKIRERQLNQGREEVGRLF